MARVGAATRTTAAVPVDLFYGLCWAQHTRGEGCRPS